MSPATGRRGSANKRLFNVEVDLGSTAYSGSYHVDDGVVHVGSAYGSKSSPLDTSAPREVARRLLHEIIAGKASARSGPRSKR